MKGIYLGRCRAYHPKFDLDYNDILPGYHINIVCDMLSVDLSKYDCVLATPPCNYYSKCNYRRDSSKYALETKHLLPDCLIKLFNSGKPFIVENVRNSVIFKQEGIYDLCNSFGIFIYEYGRHTYFTNIMFEPRCCVQRQDFKSRGERIDYGDEHSKYNQGGFNVHNVLDWWLTVVAGLLDD